MPDIEKLTQKKDIKGLIKALKSKKNWVRSSAADGLGKIGDARAVEPLIQALDDGWGVRSSAVEALGEIGDPRAVEPLIKALKDDEISVRRDAAMALGKIGDPRAVEPLIKALKRRPLNNEEWKVRERAVLTLGEIGDLRAVEPLIQALKDKVNSVRKAAAEILVKIGKTAIVPLIQALKDWNAKSFKISLSPTSRALENEAKNLNYSRKLASKALDKLDWKPDTSEVGAIFLIYKGQLDKCVEIGKPAVKPLITYIHQVNL